MNLADQTCRPRPDGTPPLRTDEWRPLAAQVPAWRVVDDHHLARELACPDFRSALDLVVAIGAEAEAQQHHPDIELSWGRIGLTLFSHDIGGLSLADFVLAARIDRLLGGALDPDTRA
ncbi:MAG: 4a-hydroxytetrahydrobiopterin dehydratase [Planctomycetota bacterium]|nr:MAG: 4a-hydroxytetrahydrobiopterin dehydratase [Planctomycetota bacterium]